MRELRAEARDLLATTCAAVAPSTAQPVYGSPSPRAVQSAHDCSATPHCSSPPPLVIESPKASTPRRWSIVNSYHQPRMPDPTRSAIGTWSGGRFMHFGEPLDDDAHGSAAAAR